jgi:hypothetical protein
MLSFSDVFYYISLRMRLNFSVFFDIISPNSVGFVWIFIVPSSECLWSWSDGRQEVKNICMFQIIFQNIAMVFYQPRGQCERLSRRLVLHKLSYQNTHELHVTSRSHDHFCRGCKMPRQEIMLGPPLGTTRLVRAITCAKFKKAKIRISCAI